MVVDGGTISGAAIFTATLKISQVVYELKAVGEQTRDLLDSTNHIQSTMQAVRTLRRQKSIHLEKTEKEWIDDVLRNTEKTLSNVAQLIEPARVDMETKFGHVGLVNRTMFVFRDSPKVATNLSRLGLASQSLHTVMNILCTREGQPVAKPPERSPYSPSEGSDYGWNDLKFPPAYEENEFLNRRRSQVSLRKSSANGDAPIKRMHSVGEEAEAETESATTADPATVTDSEKDDDIVAISDLKISDEDKLPISPVVTITEVKSAPVEQSKADRFSEADGMQVCENWASSNSPWRNPQFLDQEARHQTWQRDQLEAHRRYQYMCWREEQEAKQNWPPAPDAGRESWITASPVFDPNLDGRPISMMSKSESILSGSTAISPTSFSFSSTTSSGASRPDSIGGAQGQISRPVSTMSENAARCSSISSTPPVGVRSTEQQAPRPMGRSQRRAWLEFQAAR